jgi:aspirochlorine biosynthesis cytochrome P450 monooxygenase
LLYNVTFHPLAKYPGPLLWRATRLPAAYHHATGDLYKCIATFHDQYGAIVRIAPDELSFTSPDAWPQIYNSRPQLVKTKFHFATSEGDPNFPESMITAPDAEHARLRRLAGPAFLNSGIAEVEPVLQHYSDLLISQLKASSKEGSQNMVEWFLWTLNDVIGQLALDQQFECLDKRRMHPWPSFLLGSLKATAALNQFKRYGISLKIIAPLLPKKVAEQRDMFINTAKDATARRLAREKDEVVRMEHGVGDQKRDIVGLMLRELKGGDKLSPAEITSNSILIVGGGAETTSSCMSGLWWHLLKTPRVYNHIRQLVRDTFPTNEDITIKACNNLPYLKATIDEALRIFPIASYITPRVTPKGGYVIDGQHVPEDVSKPRRVVPDTDSPQTYVSMGQWYMGRSDRFFDSPMEFRPERWLESDAKDVNGRPLDDVLRPFSLGPRNCLGKL